MSGFVPFMQSAFGRMLRIVVGIALVLVGTFMVGGTGGTILLIVGLIPLVAGLSGICLFAPLFGYKVNGEPVR